VNGAQAAAGVVQGFGQDLGMIISTVARVHFTAGTIAVLATLVTAGSASAFGDRCYGNVRANGQVGGSMRAARDAARSAWENAVARRYGDKYASWTYSGDRTFECSWNGDGSRIRCIADALPCGRL
jgi:hypothetical protein